MSVRVDTAEIFLTGRCGAEDAEALLVALQAEPGRSVDLSGATRVHLAVAQVLLAARAQVHGAPPGDFQASHLLNLLQ